MAVQEAKRAYSVAEVAAMLGLQKQTVHLALRRQELPSFRVGGKVLVPRQAVERLLEGGGTTQDSHATNSND